MFLALTGAFVVLATTAAAKGTFPETLPLPDGFQPEGISIGKGATFYVGSIPTGAVYRGNLRTGAGAVLVPGVAGRAAIGIEFDRGRLFVAGGPTGKAFVYDAASGALTREVQLATGAGGTFVNDVVVTKKAAYFTDSLRAVLYRLPLESGGAPGATPQVVPLTGDYQQVAGFNLNGIDATPDGTKLVVVQSATGKLFVVEAASGASSEIDLGGTTLPNGDGLLLEGRTLYVVQNRLNTIAVVKLVADLSSGRVTRTITDPDFDVPTTIDRFGNHLYAVNARFGNPTPSTATYDVVKVRR